MVSKVEVKLDKSKRVTSCYTPKNEQGQKKNANVFARGIVASSSSVRRPESKDTNLKKKVLLNTKSKSTSKDVKKPHSSVIQIVLWIVDSEFLKHMTGNLKLLRSFLDKFIGIVRFENDNFAAITGYGDYVQGNLTICHNLDNVDLLTGSRDSNLYTISISEMAASSLVCLVSKAMSTHRRLSHLNFGTINHLTKQDLVDGLPRFKFDIDHLCSTCEQGKSKNATFPPKLVLCTNSKLKLIHMDLCGPIRVETINSKRYILVIVDDYSRYTWVYFLRTKDEAPEMIIKFINQIQRNMKVQVLKVQSDNGTEFKNEKLRNRTLVEAARTMLIFSRVPEFLWDEVFAITYFTQNRSLVHTKYNKTLYELIKGRKPNVQYFHVFSSFCYPINDRDDLRKMKPKADIGIFIGYSESSRGFRIYNHRTRKIMETIYVKFDELTTMASEYTPSSSSIIVEEYEVPQLVSSSDEPIENEPTTLVFDNHSNELVHEDIAK
ncbi:retrovirus-related pol polyprotein from transposon TNT 1-94 [Tanacetum coccineum]